MRVIGWLGGWILFMLVFVLFGRRMYEHYIIWEKFEKTIMFYECFFLFICFIVFWFHQQPKKWCKISGQKTMFMFIFACVFFIQLFFIFFLNFSILINRFFFHFFFLSIFKSIFLINMFLFFFLFILNNGRHYICNFSYHIFLIILIQVLFLFFIFYY